MADNRIRILAQLDDKVSSELDKIRDKFDKIGGKGAGASFFGNVGAKGLDLIGGAALKAGEAVGDFVNGSIDAASDLNESMSKSGVIFGSASDDVEKFAETADKSLGLSKAAALEAAASFGNLFLGAGRTQKDAAGLSKAMVGLAGDLASFNNLDPTETLEKLRSGLTGEAEPLRAVGVFLTEAKVKAKAMELGLADAHGELTEGEKVLARYQIILDETGTAQGDFARTSDELANAERTKNAELANLQAKAGLAFLPIAKEVTKAQIGLFEGLVLVADQLTGNLTPAVIEYSAASNQLGLIEGDVRRKLHELGEESLAAALKVGIITAAEYEAEIASRSLSAATKYMSSHVKDDTERASDAVLDLGYGAKRAADEIATASGRIIDSIVGVREAAIAESDKVVTGYYDVLIAQDNLAATNAEIAALRKIASGRKLTAEEKANLNRLQQTQADLVTDLASHGKTQSKAFTGTMEDLLKRLRNAHGAEADMIRALIRQLNLLAAKAALASIFNAGSGYTTWGGGQASGGPVKANTAYVVGEEGPELFIPDGSGEIIPNGGTPGYILPSVPQGGGSTSIVLHYSPQYSTASPAEAQRFADAVVPAITRSMRRQSIL